MRKYYLMAFSVSLSLFSVSSSAVISLNEIMFQGNPDINPLDFYANEMEYQVLHVTSNVESGYSDMKAILDPDFKLIKFKYVTSAGNTKEFNPENLSKGVVILEKEGKEIIKLMSNNFDSKLGGDINLVYIYNGITNSYRKFPMEIVQEGREWHLQKNDTAGRSRFSSMRIIGRKIFGQLVGIGKIEVF
jgi:hypothetical protein